MNINSTTDYGQFKHIVGNRGLNKAHLNRLEKSILKNNLLDKFPGIVNKHDELVDGQHRLEVARKNNLLFYYTIVPDAGMEQVVDLNVSSKPWSLLDFFHSFIDRGFPEYIKLGQFMQKYKEYNMSMSNAAMLIGADKKGTQFHFQGERTGFKFGQFKAENIQRGDAVMLSVIDLSPFLRASSIMEDRDFLKAIMKLMRMDENGEISWKELLTQFDKSGKQITRQFLLRNYLEVFEEVYSYNKKTRIRFF